MSFGSRSYLYRSLWTILCSLQGRRAGRLLPRMTRLPRPNSVVNESRWVCYDRNASILAKSTISTLNRGIHTTLPLPKVNSLDGAAVNANQHRMDCFYNANPEPSTTAIVLELISSDADHVGFIKLHILVGGTQSLLLQAINPHSSRNDSKCQQSNHACHIHSNSTA